MSKPLKPVVARIAIEADANGNAPTEIMLLKVGNWNTPWHGDFEMTPDDMLQYVDHFNMGIGLVEEDKKRMQVNYGHNSGGKAAGWVTELQARNNNTELWASIIEWTPEGEKAVKEKEYAYISPEWNPRSWPWEDPEVIGRYVVNVITGAALTNIPLFKKLKPMMASIVTGASDKPNLGGSMKLEDIRAKKAEDLTADERTFLEEHKADLTDDERKTFKLEEAELTDEQKAEAAAAEQKAKDDAEAEAKAKEASAKTTTINADRLTQLEADAKAGREASQKLARKEAEDLVQGHVNGGRIKSDESEKTVELLLSASSADQRKQFEDHLAALPANPLLAGERGDSGGNTQPGSAATELHEKVVEKVSAAAKEGSSLSYVQARKTILKADAALAERVKAEQEGK